MFFVIFAVFVGGSSVYADYFDDDDYGDVGGSYCGIHYNQTTYDESTISIDSSVVVLNFGKKILPFFALEGRAGIGMESEEEPLDIGGNIYDVSLKVDSIYGVYAKGLLRAKRVQFFALIGYSDVTGTISGEYSNVVGSQKVTIEGSESGMSYGAGLDIFVSETSSFGAEYISYVDKDDFNVTSMSLGLTVLF